MVVKIIIWNNPNYRRVRPKELWITDGTAGNAHLLKEFVPGSAGGNPSGLTAINGKVAIITGDHTTTAQLWTTDDTEDGTVPFAQCTLSGVQVGVDALERVGSSLYYFVPDPVATWTLYKSDGAPAGS